jgi:hypothetical protein
MIYTFETYQGVTETPLCKRVCGCSCTIGATQIDSALDLDVISVEDYALSIEDPLLVVVAGGEAENSTENPWSASCITRPTSHARVMMCR